MTRILVLNDATLCVAENCPAFLFNALDPLRIPMRVVASSGMHGHKVGDIIAPQDNDMLRLADVWDVINLELGDSFPDIMKQQTKEAAISLGQLLCIAAILRNDFTQTLTRYRECEPALKHHVASFKESPEADIEVVEQIYIHGHALLRDMDTYHNHLNRIAYDYDHITKLLGVKGHTLVSLYPDDTATPEWESMERDLEALSEAVFMSKEYTDNHYQYVESWNKNRVII